MISRSIVTAVLAAVSAFAAPPLTTIQDVLYKADGTRFNGTLTIRWNSFEAADSSAITMQNTTIRVVNGLLRVQLVPTVNSSPAASYTVTYNSDGKIRFQETWSVPASTQAVRVRDVRVDSQVSGGQAAGSTDPIQESDVTGLEADLSERPIKEPGYAGGRVAVVNEAGALESAAGDPSDCVRVDGSSGACGSASISFADGETPAGIVDGANTHFSLASQPNPVSSLAVYRNGLLQKIGQDFTLSGSGLTFVAAAAPLPGDTLLASYRMAGDSSGAAVPPVPQVLCAGTGADVTATAMTPLASCAIGAGVLLPGDRVEVRFDLAHQGSASGFSFEAHWGGTTLAHRDAAASDVLAAARVEGGLHAAGAQFGFQSWGTVLPFSAGVAAAADEFGPGLTVEIAGKLTSAGDTLSLRSFAVVRVP